MILSDTDRAMNEMERNKVGGSPEAVPEKLCWGASPLNIFDTALRDKIYDDYPHSEHTAGFVVRYYIDTPQGGPCGKRFHWNSRS